MSETLRVQGRPSPRWALWQRFTIPCQSGEDYLTRLRIVQTPWFALLLHDIHEPDDGRDPHNHPWSFLSLVLRGHYVEYVYPDPASDRYHFIVRHRSLSVHRMGRSSAHRIVEVGPRLKTLILVGRRASGWGFFIDGEYVPWQEYPDLVRAAA